MSTDAIRTVRVSAQQYLDGAARDKVRAGDTQALLRAIATFARAWLQAANVQPAMYSRVTRSEIAGCHHAKLSAPPDAVQRAFLAAGCDVIELMALSHEGRQALRDLGFEPVTDDAERKG